LVWCQRCAGCCQAEEAVLINHLAALLNRLAAGQGGTVSTLHTHLFKAGFCSRNGCAHCDTTWQRTWRDQQVQLPSLALAAML
jgi:hypothetical protein